MSIWDKMTSEEKTWILEEGYSEEDANNDVEDTISFLHIRYASHGKILAEAHEMDKTVTVIRAGQGRGQGMPSAFCYPRKILLISNIRP